MSLIKKYLPLTLFLILLLSNCEKWNDYRKKYLDYWKFEVSFTREIFGPVHGINMFHDTTTTTIHKGEFRLGSIDNAILFVSTGYSKEFQISKEGEIIPVNDMGWNYDEYGGFEGRKIFRYYYSHKPGAMLHGKMSTGIYGTRE